MKFLLLPLLALAFSNSSLAKQSYDFPESIDKNASYVFYSHGYIVQGDNEKPVHPKWGVYDFPAVKNALSDPSYQLIAYHRPANTSPFEYSEKLAAQINELLSNGVPAKNISLVGFSQGGFITAITSSILKNTELSFVILASCTSSLGRNKDIRVHGHLFSIYETSDTVGSCNQVVARSGDSVSSYKEISISTGEEHGAFYRPIKPWLSPVKAWLKRDKP